MQSLLKLVLVEDGTPEGARRLEERRRRIRVEDYLDHLCAPLIGILPYEERLALRTETEEHLYALIEDREGDGLDAAAATETALKEYGEPWRIGQQFVDAWCRSRMPQSGVFSRYMGAATLRAFAFFGFASMANLLAIQYAALNPAQHNTLAFWLTVLNVVSPIISGILTGILVPVRTGRAVANALGISMIHTALVAAAMWPNRDGLDLLLAEALGWLPAGALVATLAATASRHLHRTLFLQRWAIR